MTQLKTPAAVLTLLCSFFLPVSKANEALNAINIAVEQKAVQIDQNYGVLLTTQERNDLKVALVVNKLANETKNMSAAQVALQTQKAMVVFEITDPIEQRKLLIGLQALAKDSTGNVGNEPP